MRQIAWLECIDQNAPSYKYPQWGYSVEFRDRETGRHYYVEYPKITPPSLDFQDKKIYHIAFNIRTEHTFDGKISETKITHIKIIP